MQKLEITEWYDGDDDHKKAYSKKNYDLHFVRFPIKDFRY